MKELDLDYSDHLIYHPKQTILRTKEKLLIISLDDTQKLELPCLPWHMVMPTAHRPGALIVILLLY